MQCASTVLKKIMSEEPTTKKERKEQKKADQTVAQQAEQKKKRMWYVLGGIVALLIIVWIVRNLTAAPAPEAGDIPDPVKGPKDALVKIVEYGDFQCPACAKMYPLLQIAAEDFGDNISIEFNDFPLTQIHPNAFAASEAAQCANVQDAFWPYHDLLYEDQSGWDSLSNPEKTFIEYAEQLKLDVDQFSQCVKKRETKSSVLEDVKEANSASVQSTPTLFINGERYTGVGTYDDLAKKIREHIQAAQKKNAELFDELTAGETTDSINE